MPPGRPQTTMRFMPFACWVTKATDKPSQYLILTALPRQQWSCERASITFVHPLPALFDYISSPCFSYYIFIISLLFRFCVSSFFFFVSFLLFPLFILFILLLSLCIYLHVSIFIYSKLLSMKLSVLICILHCYIRG